ncbi:FN3 associated domain-containing protein [Halobacillus karajensis]|uniref:RNA-binding protein, contains TRAM domain n=1 Tax=Halobacillus karajensis TaxID=195088 RepID=A0A024P4J2_9BACI|nr:FN3 associated domain-containing protein [Halobacillus karajensis]CDQ19195.1 putative RNA-binding protein, contains TRAM domain [Halobacillus karajensis]CDQ22731.1 putative RNA-binding protein, contains TRAM domain [Halobacillus karajensis]CDQ26213.1 putative RNA-binding protein, contains TRAM domain [Halobacillus karajensis]
MKKLFHLLLMALLGLSYIVVPTSSAKAEGMDDLIISEYVEGSSYNKALEIYNGTGESVDLSDYTMELYTNGNTNPQYTFPMSGELSDGEVYVLTHSSAGDELQAIVDVNSTVTNFNGDDVVVLKNDNGAVDSIGQIGATEEFGKDLTLVRKAEVITGDRDPENAFQVREEWDTYNKDTFEYLGSYEMPEEEEADLQTVVDARQTEEGTTVRVEGVVTAAFEAGGQTNLYIQDETAGIIVRAPGLNIHPGDRVQAQGETSDYYGMAQLLTSSASVEVIESDAGIPQPEVVDSSQFSPSNGEEVEGEFVQVNHMEITDKNQHGEFTAKDEKGKFLIQPQNEEMLNVGDTFEQVKGVVDYSFNEYKLIPRTESDLIEEVFAVTADPEAGAVVQGTEVALDTAEPDATIHYTTDGSEPTAESRKYEFPIVITKDTTVKAVVVRANGDTSKVAVFSYTALKALDDVEIHDIQGASHTSPYEGEQVKGVEGIVTKLDGNNGFYIQSLTPDDDIATSEGIYVYKRSSGLETGDVVSVTGKVTEWREEGYYDAADLLTTQISASEVSVVSSNHPLPDPVVIGVDREQPTEVVEDDQMESFDPTTDGLDFYESLEGMLIELPEPKVTGPVKYDELPVYVETKEDQGFTRAGGLLISPEDYNPERMLIDVDGFDVKAKTGDYFDDSITGVVSYDYSNYKIRVAGDLPELQDGNTKRESAKLKGLKPKMTVATYNMENFHAGTDPEKVQRIAESMVENLNTPDVVGLVEVQDNNGPTDDGTVQANESYQTLIDAIVEAGGPEYEYTDIAPLDKADGGQPGGNIRVGFIYNPERVALTDKPSGDAVTAVDVDEDGLTLNPGRIDPLNEAFEDSRKSVAAEFEFNGEKVVVVANHFNSKGGDGALFGSEHPIVLGSEVQRQKQAKVLNDFVEKVEDRMDNSNVVVLGDLNDFEFSAPVQTLKGDVLTNMMEELPEEERYTYIYQGNSQVLDHILVSNHMAKRTKVETININSDFSEADGRASDHDPVLAQIHLK